MGVIYDGWGASTGQSGPLGDLCGNSPVPRASARAFVKRWTLDNGGVSCEQTFL
ncbi:hypothetical protein BDM02DRAFT_3108062 [Thelephora ganbajun]|uniref:Uncharacterized protein n=1 Tax=Thelephora ganbajun TaxID=370292 RepID=A0ACB6ZV49_THEGA|nr:hypothetical protein BDM02DRAFT_3108062 [Thelephora ganbajun]